MAIGVRQARNCALLGHKPCGYSGSRRKEEIRSPSSLGCRVVSVAKMRRGLTIGPRVLEVISSNVIVFRGISLGACMLHTCQLPWSKVLESTAVANMSVQICGNCVDTARACCVQDSGVREVDSDLPAEHVETEATAKLRRSIMESDRLHQSPQNYLKDRKLADCWE